MSAGRRQRANSREGAGPPRARRPMGAEQGGARPEARAATHVSAWGRRGRGGTSTGRERPGHRNSGTGTGTPARPPRACPETLTSAGKRGQRHRRRDTDTGTVIPALGQGREQRHRDRDTGTTAGAGGSRQPRLELNAARDSSGGANPAMEPPARACSCGSPASDSGAEAESSPRSPPKAERSRKRPGGMERASPESPPSPRGGKRPRKGEGGDVPPSDGDRLFAQKCRELRGFIRPLAELLEGLRRGRYDRGLSSFQQSVAMDRLQRIIGVLQKPEMGARYLGTLLQVEAMLRLWFPHVAPKPALDSAPPAAPPRRRPPAGPAGAPRCRRLPGELPLASPAGTLQQRGAPESPPAPDV
ncbi:circadian-associated transcriptional repressor isoform X1 [Agelaius phoeniceus]|uniref:circadian-associated transcriptional repressor isoform X1 n=1 Tax=Agelaius phoeniceus TaxID=39638 RepID=UPI00405527AB